MVDYKDFGIRVRAARRRLGMTQEELAEKAGISPSFLGHIERGTRIASLETLVLLCNALHVTPQALLTASLDSAFSDHMPNSLSLDDRSKLSSFLRLAQDTLIGWEE